MAASRPQLAIALMSSTAFIASFFLIYPGGFLFYVWNAPAEALPKVTFEGLKDRYRVGEELAFSVKVEGYWNDDGGFPETEVKKVADINGEATDAMIWFDGGIKGSSESYDQNPDHIYKVRHIAGNVLDPLTLEEPGIYAVITQGDNVERAEERFRVS